MTKRTPKADKSAAVTSIQDLLSRSKSVAVVDYRGLKVNQATELRRAVKKAGGEVLIAKNTLFKIASNHTDLDISGTSAFIFAMSDEVTPLKAVADFAKKNALPVFKLGLLGDRVLSDKEVIALSALPDKNTLVAKTLGSLKSPLFGLVYNLNWPISQLVRTLDAVRAKRR